MKRRGKRITTRGGGGKQGEGEGRRTGEGGKVILQVSFVSLVHTKVKATFLTPSPSALVFIVHERLKKRRTQVCERVVFH